MTPEQYESKAKKHALISVGLTTMSGCAYYLAFICGSAERTAICAMPTILIASILLVLGWKQICFAVESIKDAQREREWEFRAEHTRKVHKTFNR